MRKSFSLCILAICFALVSCSKIDTSAKLIEVERFDRDVFTLDTLQLGQKYGEFLPVYIYGVLRLPSIDQLYRFTSDSGIVALNADVQRIYANHSAIEKELNNAFNYYHYYFPEMEIPRVLFHISGFNQAIVTADGFLSASIDQYLGSDYEPYQSIAYGYEIPFMTKEQLPVDMMYGWVTSVFQEILTGDRLIDQMIFQGKLIYLLKVFFPDTPECRLLGYTQEQFDWCERYEKEVWGYIMENRELFSTDWKVATKYLTPAPFTSGLNRESPGKIGVYLGYKIVESYMKHNSDITPAQLMQPAESQQFLQGAEYRP